MYDCSRSGLETMYMKSWRLEYKDLADGDTKVRRENKVRWFMDRTIKKHSDMLVDPI